jgi:hypothetical protein
VVIAIIAVLVGILLPSLGGARLAARTVACGSNLRQLGVGMTSYLADFPDRLPQALGPLPNGGEAIIGSLFGGKKGRLPFYGIDTIGPERRPLNRYVWDSEPEPDANGGNAEMPIFRSPVDRGATNTGVPIPGFDSVTSMYELLGSSYALNDHTLEGDAFTTLVPAGGGRMPPVANPSRTWALGTHTIYNFQQGGDRGMRWFGGGSGGGGASDSGGVAANLLFVDMHVKTRVDVPRGVVNTTSAYTFLP